MPAGREGGEMTTEFSILALARLVVALARLAGVTPRELAGMYQDGEGSQQYYDDLLEWIAITRPGTSD